MSDPRPSTEDATASPLSQAHVEQASEATGPYTPQTLFAESASGKEPPNPFGNRYQLHDELARGGMGVVYAATDLVFDRLVAIKVLAPKLVGTTAARRFLREARITGRLQHPSIPPVHDLGTLEDGESFLAMKLIRGRTFATTIQEARSASEDSQAEAFDKLVAIFEQICLAVAFAHSRRVIHRDLKPQNVMVGAFGEIQVMDWGLAKELESPNAEESPTEPEFHDDPDERTMMGNVMGTPSYMPPEQARGETNALDERADVFSLGAILCVILTGKPPYTGTDGHEVWTKASAANLEDAITRLSAVRGHGRLVVLAKRCLHAEPRKRPAHAGEVAAAVYAARVATEETKREQEFRIVQGDAEVVRNQAFQKSRTALWIATVGFVVSTVLAVSAWRYGQRVAEQARADAREQFQDLRDAITFADTQNRFLPSEDAPFRDRIIRRLRDLRRTLDPTQPDAIQVELLMTGISDVAQIEHQGMYHWNQAVDLFASRSDHHAGKRFAIQIVDWFGQSPASLSNIDRALLMRADKVLSTKPTSEPPPELLAEIKKARTRLNELGIKSK